MKKLTAFLFCLCLFLAVFYPGIVTAHKNVDDTGCLTCHDASFGTGSLHNTHTDKACTICHRANGDTPASAKCIVCHPTGNPGTCPLVVTHEAGSAVCFSCHQDCEQVTTTTTTPVTTTTTPVTTTTTTPVTTTTPGGCPSEEIYGDNSVEVRILRALRDGVLSKTPEGRELIKLYYRWAPVITMAVRHDPALKAQMKELVDGIMGWSVE